MAMPTIELNGRTYPVDENGFLQEPGIWNDDVARDFATTEGITEMTDEHWVLVRYLRDYYLKFGIAPMVRKLCKDCKEEINMPAQALMDIGYAPEVAPKVKLYKGKGCATCNSTGYKGRVGLYEVMEISDSIREMILTGASSVELKNKAIEEGMITLRGSGLRKIQAAMTTVEEVVRETVL